MQSGKIFECPNSSRFNRLSNYSLARKFSIFDFRFSIFKLKLIEKPQFQLVNSALALTLVDNICYESID